MKALRFRDWRVADVMSRELVTASPEEALSEVLGKMRKADIHEIPVVEDKTLVGLISYSNLIRRRSLPLTTKVESIMTTPPKVSEEDDLASVAEMMMSSGYRAIPVASKKKLAGIISRTDIVRAMQKMEDLKGIAIDTIMTPSPQCVNEDDSILQARKLMHGLDERSIPVIDQNGKVTGVIGVKDLTKIMWKPKEKESKGEFAGEKAAIDIEVKGVMRSPAISVGPKAEVVEVAKLMTENDISSVVVVEEEKPVGIVTQVDLMELLAGFKVREELYVQITGLEEEPGVYDSMYDLIQKGMKRVGKIITPRILNIHVVQHHGEGGRAKYSIRARMTTEEGMYYAKGFDWDLFKTMDDVIRQLEKRVKKEKEWRLRERRRGNYRFK